MLSSVAYPFSPAELEKWYTEKTQAVEMAHRENRKPLRQAVRYFSGDALTSSVDSCYDACDSPFRKQQQQHGI